MIHIDIKQIKSIREVDQGKYILDIMSKQYVKKFDDFLKNRCDKYKDKANDENSPEYIYYILKELKGIEKNKYKTTPPNLITIFLEDMDIIIKEIQKIPAWKTMTIKTEDCNGHKWESNESQENCKKCKTAPCLDKRVYTIYTDLYRRFVTNGYEAWCNNPNSKPKDFFKPYDFIKSLNIKACPYCNLEYVQVATFKRKIAPAGEDKYVRPDLDHFYPKSKYPFFALCLYNLVPSCKTCNSSIKHEDDSLKSYKKIIHPYDEEKINYSDCIKYILMDVPQRSIEKLLDKYGEKLKDDLNELGISLAKDAKNILIEGAPPKDNLTEKEENEYIRAKRMFDYFAIKPRIEQGHSDYIREISVKAIEYPKDYINELETKGYDFFDRLRLYFGNYINTEDFNLRPLSKITHDVIEHLRPDILNKLKKKKT